MALLKEWKATHSGQVETDESDEHILSLSQKTPELIPEKYDPMDGDYDSVAAKLGLAAEEVVKAELEQPEVDAVRAKLGKDSADL